MREFIINFLNTNVASNFYYHCTAHTLYVADKVIEIGEKENCTEEEIKLLVAAALWHDTGYSKSAINHEDEGCLLARKHLPDFGFSNLDIDTICDIIMATKMPQSPKNKLEEIIADADLEYLGTDNAEIFSMDLFKELNFLNPDLTIDEWDKIQISFLQKHTYFTKYCIQNKKLGKQKYLDKLIAKVY